MKKRVFIDGFILWSAGAACLALFFIFPQTYLIHDRLFDNLLDIYGLALILKGVMIRMTARGHKAQFPRWDLVMTGPYRFVRNPMYLGTFLIVAGIICVCLPIWVLPVFCAAFYVRFNRTAKHEEQQLAECHKENYIEYCRNVPRMFPRVNELFTIKTKEFFSWEEMITTKEKQLLVVIPVLAYGLDGLQEWRVLSGWMPSFSAILFLSTYAAFSFIFYLFYKWK